MSKKNLESIISKYLNNQASKIEIEELLAWLEDAENLKLFNKYIAVNHLLNTNFKKFDSVKAYKKSVLLHESKNRKSTFFKYAIAASIALLISVTLFFNNDKPVPTPNIVNNTIKIGSKKAVLTLEDGSIVALKKGIDYKNNNVESNGEELVYNTANKKNVAYNYLTIPRGGQFFLHLADGTKVWLNSDSKLKYPINFIEGKTREVELVYGEAYFDVSPSEKHAGASFRVISKNQQVEVLGTKFNIKAYNDEDNVYTTLVEGKVAVESNRGKAVLKPEQQSIYNNLSLKVIEVDVYNEVSWHNGVFSFKGKTLKDIMIVLSRWYDMQFTFNSKVLEQEKFVGVLNKHQKIENILETIKNTGFINNYQIHGNKIILE